MSANTIQAFVQAVNKDSQLQGRVAALNGNVEGLVKLAADAGYSFTAQDWRTAVSGELSEGDLDTVSGGDAVLQERPQPLIRALVDPGNFFAGFTK
jgi:predicted ribosomally synthesized peptide with nif11-like leader